MKNSCISLARNIILAERTQSRSLPLREATGRYVIALSKLRKMKISIILSTLILFIFSGCNIFEESKNLILKEYSNPKKNLKIIVFKKNGNATVNNSIQFLVENNNHILENADFGNIFIIEETEFKNLSKDSLFLVKWSGNYTVEISYPNEAKIIKKEKNIENGIGKVNIIYKTKKPSHNSSLAQ